MANPRIFFIEKLHGASGDSCWHSKETKAYWPTLLAEEPELGNLGIYVSNYRSDWFAGNYTVREAADSLTSDLRLDGLFNVKRWIFICHSLGGIVARTLLVTQEHNLPKDIQIGLFLIASPSMGSVYANLLQTVIGWFRHSQAQMLRFSDNNHQLMDLDRNFRELYFSRRLNIHGKELVENDFVWFPRFFRRPVVERFSGDKYFVNAEKIAYTNHWTIAEPRSRKAKQHRLLVEFVKQVTKGLSTMPDTTQIEILEHAEDLLKEYAKTIEILERERKRQLTDDEAKEVDGPELRVFPGELEDVWKELRELKAEGHQLDSPTIYDFLGPYVLMCDRSKVLWADEPKPKSPEWWGDFLEFRDEMKLEDERRKRYGEPYYGSNMPLSRTERNKPAASNSPG